MGSCPRGGETGAWPLWPTVIKSWHVYNNNSVLDTNHLQQTGMRPTLYLIVLFFFWIVSSRLVPACAGREAATRKTVTIPTPTKLALHSPRAWLWSQRSPGAACMLPIAKAAPSAPWRWRMEPLSLWSVEKETQWWEKMKGISGLPSSTLSFLQCRVDVVLLRSEEH